MIIKNEKLNDGNTNMGGPMITVWGQSTVSSDDAIQQAVNATRANLRGATLLWMELIEVRGGFDSNTGTLAYQVAVKIGYIGQ